MLIRAVLVTANRAINEKTNGGNHGAAACTTRSSGPSEAASVSVGTRVEVISAISR